MRTIQATLKTLLAGAAASVLIMSTHAQALTLKLATDSGTKGSPAGDALKKWGELIEQKSDGEIKAKVF